MDDSEYDVEMLMLYLERSTVPDKLPGSRAVIQFRFKDFKERPCWWITVNGENVDVCTSDPELYAEIFITSNVRAMSEAWLGNSSYRKAQSEGDF